MSDTPKASDNEKLSIENKEGDDVSTNESREQVSQELEIKQEISEKVKDVSESSRKHFKYRSNECLNCGQPLDLSDRYCPYCSQLNSTKQLSFGDFFREFFSSLISYDSRLWFTLKHLLLKPGTITKKYVEGHRLRYANPFRFFLSVSIIYFLLNGFLSFIMPSNDFINSKDNSGVVKYDLNDGDVVKVIEDEAGFFEARDEPFVSNPDWENEVAQAHGNDSSQVATTVSKKQTPKISEEKKEAEPKKASVSEKDTTVEEKEIAPVYATEEKLQKMNFFEGSAERFSTYNKFWENTDITNSGRALDSLNHPPTRFNLWLYEKNNVAKRIQDDPEKFINYLSGKVPFFLFFFAPFFALFIWLIYSKKKYSYMEHLVFIFHIFSFIFLALLIIAIPSIIFDTDILIGVLFLFIGPFYLYKALRNFYKQSRLITIIKFVFLNNVFLIAATIAAVFFFAATAAIY